jgi:hypothetical protein
MFVSFRDGSTFSNQRSDARYAIMFVSFGDIKTFFQKFKQTLKPFASLRTLRLCVKLFFCFYHLIWNKKTASLQGGKIYTAKILR